MRIKWEYPSQQLVILAQRLGAEALLTGRGGVTGSYVPDDILAESGDSAGSLAT